MRASVVSLSSTTILLRSFTPMDALEDPSASSRDGANSQVKFLEPHCLIAVPNNVQGVYIYRPTDLSKAHGERPTKRRKVLSSKQEPEQNVRLFAPLLNGNESPESVDLRYKTFRRLWDAQEAKIQVSMHSPSWPYFAAEDGPWLMVMQGVLNEADSEVLESVASFVRSTSPET